MSSDQVYIFDTTLRDGEQSPGVALSPSAKLAIAEQLARLGVDIIEAGFPQASAGDLDAVRLIADQVREPVIAALARCHPSDIEAAARALESAERPRIHVFIASSAVHMEAKLKMTPDQVLDRVGEMVAKARSYVEDVEFSAEDATRSEPGFLVDLAKLAASMGARTINLPDTVGYTTPEEYRTLVTLIREALDDPKIRLSVHCHDDLGLAVANTLAGIEAGVRQVEVAVNGIGERAGNAALEEVVMAITARKDQFQVQHRIQTRELFRTSQLVSRLCGMMVQPNKAIVGRNAFRHESGIHQDGMLKDRRTYEILTPDDIGVEQTLLVLGKHSGRHALRQRLSELGLSASSEELVRIQNRIKGLAEVKSEINDQDLVAVWQDEVQGVKVEDIDLVAWQVSTGTHMRPTAQVAVRFRGKVREDSAIGDGPVHALFQALSRALDLNGLELASYRLVPVSPGEEGLAAVSVEVSGYGHRAAGYASDVDVLKGSALALTDAMGSLAGRVLPEATGVLGAIVE